MNANLERVTPPEDVDPMLETNESPHTVKIGVRRARQRNDASMLGPAKHCGPNTFGIGVDHRSARRFWGRADQHVCDARARSSGTRASAEAAAVETGYFQGKKSEVLLCALAHATGSISTRQKADRVAREDHTQGGRDLAQAARHAAFRSRSPSASSGHHPASSGDGGATTLNNIRYAGLARVPLHAQHP